MAKLQKVIYILENDYETLLNTGQVTIGGKTYLLDENAEYRICRDYSPADHTHTYEELKNKPIGNGTVTINQNGSLKASFQLNTSVPSSSKLIELTNTKYGIGTGSALGKFSPVYKATGKVTYNGKTSTATSSTMVNSPTTKSNRNFPVGVDSLGRAFVNIPFPNEPDIIYNKQYTTNNSSIKYTAYSIKNTTYGSVKIFTAWLSSSYLLDDIMVSFPSGFFSSTPFIIGSFIKNLAISYNNYFAIFDPDSTGCAICFTGPWPHLGAQEVPDFYLIAIEISRNGQITSNSEYVV